MSEGKTNYDYKPQFFLEILKAVCLSVDWVPKLIQNLFPTMEQKLVQRCDRLRSLQMLAMAPNGLGFMIS